MRFGKFCGSGLGYLCGFEKFIKCSFEFMHSMQLMWFDVFEVDVIRFWMFRDLCGLRKFVVCLVYAIVY